MDFSVWEEFQSIVSMGFVFDGAGTVDMTTTVFGVTETETMDWTVDDSELCIDGDYVSYTLSDDESTLVFVASEAASCENYDDDV